MAGRIYSQHLGLISDEQFQAALDHFNLGRLLQAEPIPFGLFGQNIFITSTEGEYVLRGGPHFWWQFPTEQFYTRFLHERTRVPAPWPYLIDAAPDIFGWSYVLMPRMPGLQLADPHVSARLQFSERRAIAGVLGESLAFMQEAKWPYSGRYNAATDNVEPFDLAHELAWPFPVESDPQLLEIPPTSISYSERVIACLRHHLTNAQAYNAAATTQQDMAWVEELIADAGETLDDTFEPCIVLEDYKSANLVVTQQNEQWRVSGVFDLMEAHFGDGEADLSRQYAVYLDEDPRLAETFLQGYLRRASLRPGFARRFPIYMLLDRAIIWAYVQRQKPDWWDGQGTSTFRDWASRYTSISASINIPERTEHDVQQDVQLMVS